MQIVNEGFRISFYNLAIQSLNKVQCDFSGQVGIRVRHMSDEMTDRLNSTKL